MAINILNRFTGAILATIPGSTLAGVNFAGLNLQNADLSNVDLTGSIFGGSNTTRATFQNSNLNGASFFGGNVQGSDFRGVTRNAATNWHACFFEDVVLDLADRNVGAWALPNFFGGQSNCVSVVAPVTAGLPDATIPYAFNCVSGADSGGAWLPLQIDSVSGNSGAEIRFCQILKALGFDIGMDKIARGATLQSEWVPGTGTFFESLIRPSLTASVANMQSVWPGKFSRWGMGWALGEDDARAVGLGATYYRLQLLQTMVGISGIVRNNVWKWFTPVRTQSWLGAAVPTCLTDIRNAQMKLATGGHFIDSDGFTHLVDNVHYDAAVTGQPAYGTSWAAAWQLVVPNSVP